MNPKRSAWLTRHPLAAFFVLAYVFSWVIEIPLALTLRGVIHADIPFGLHYLAGYGPLLSALIVTSLFEGRAGLVSLFKRMTKWRVKPVWWLFVFAPLGIYILAEFLQHSQLYWRYNQPISMRAGAIEDFSIWMMLGLRDSISNLGWVDFLPGLGIAVLPMWVLTFGIGEETGWRGFALPRLQQNRSPLSASLLLWVIWALWHLPLFLYSYQISTLPGFLAGLLAGTITLTWLYNGAGGSILMAALWHGVFNSVSACVACKSGLAAPVVSIAVMVWAVLLVIHFQQSKPRRSGEQVFSTSKPEQAA